MLTGSRCKNNWDRMECLKLENRTKASVLYILHVFIEDVIIGNASSVFDRIGAKRWSVESAN